MLNVVLLLPELADQPQLPIRRSPDRPGARHFQTPGSSQRQLTLSPATSNQLSPPLGSARTELTGTRRGASGRQLTLSPADANEFSPPLGPVRIKMTSARRR